VAERIALQQVVPGLILAVVAVNATNASMTKRLARITSPPMSGTPLEWNDQLARCLERWMILSRPWVITVAPACFPILRIITVVVQMSHTTYSG